MRMISDRKLGGDFFESRLGLYRSVDSRYILFFPDDEVTSMDDILVAVAYNSFVGRACCIHLVVQHPKSFTRSIIQYCFDYPFNECGIETLIGVVDSTNIAALDIDTRLGFMERYRMPNAGLEGDLVTLTLNKADCRWLKKAKHGQEIDAACA